MSDKKLKRAYAFFKPPIKLFAKLKYNFTAEPFSGVEGPCLVLATHTCGLDMLLMSHSFSEPLRYLASEHVTRKGLGGFLIKKCFNPIIIQKGGADISAVRGILKALRAGEWVALYPEGNCTHDGETLLIDDSIGKLAKTAGVNVLLYTVEKGFLATPRWADSVRKGPPLIGSVKQVITASQCRALSHEQLSELIIKGLYRNATPEQPENTVCFEGKNLAEHLERAFFICPKCGGMASIYTEGDGIFCKKCDFTARYLPTGYLDGDDLPFKTLSAWDGYQRKQITQIVPDDDEICSDEGESCWSILQKKGQRLLGKGSLHLYADRLEFVFADGLLRIPLADAAVSVEDKQTLTVGAGGALYEFKNDRPRSAIKYLYLIKYLAGLLRGGFDGCFGI